MRASPTRNIPITDYTRRASSIKNVVKTMRSGHRNIPNRKYLYQVELFQSIDLFIPDNGNSDMELVVTTTNKTNNNKCNSRRFLSMMYDVNVMPLPHHATPYGPMLLIGRRLMRVHSTSTFDNLQKQMWQFTWTSSNVGWR